MTNQFRLPPFVHRLTRTWLQAGISVTLLLSLTGCHTSNVSFIVTKDEAMKRWQSLRSNLTIEKAQSDLDAGDLDEAERTIRQVLAENPDASGVDLLAGRIALERGWLERAYHLFRREAQLNSENPDPHYFQGIILQRWQKFDAALLAYQNAYRLQPDHVEYLLACGEMLVALDQIDEALDVLTDKLAYFDTNVGIRLAVGQLQMMQGRYEQAIEMFQQAVLLQPDNLQIIEDLAMAYADAEQPKKAISLLRRVLSQSETERRDLQHVLADCCVMAQRLEEARDIYRQLTRKSPNDVQAWVKLGNIAWAMKDGPGTMRAAHRIVALSPDQSAGYLLAGLAWHQKGCFAPALEALDRAASLDPSSAIPLIVRGLVLEESGERRLAAQAYEAALQRKPSDRRAARLLANVNSS